MLPGQGAGTGHMNTTEKLTTAEADYAIDPVKADPGLRIAGATSYMLLSVMSLLLNAVLIRIFVKHRAQYKGKSFYVLTWQLIVGDVGTQLIQLVVAVPITYTAFPIYGEGTLLHVITSFDTVAYYCTLLFSILMTLNRLTIFLLPSVHEAMFEIPGVYKTITLCWAAVLAITVLVNASGCNKNFETNGFYLYDYCRTPFSERVDNVIYAFTAYSPVVMIVAYVAIFVHLRYFYPTTSASFGSHEKQRRRAEQRLLFQSFLICSALEVQNLAYSFSPLLNADGQWEFILNFAVNWITIANNTMTPIVMFTFNSEIRLRLNEVLKDISQRKATDNSVTINVRPSV